MRVRLSTLLVLVGASTAGALQPTPVATVMIYAGDDAPGFPASAFTAFDGFHRAIDDDGRIVFRATASDGAVSRDGLWIVSDPRQPEPVALKDDAAPGTTGKFLSFTNPRVTREGVTFQASLQVGVGGVTTANDFGTWAPDGVGGIELVAREGDAIPGLGGPTYKTELVPIAGNGGMALLELASNADQMVVTHSGIEGAGLDFVDHQTVCPDPAGATWTTVRAILLVNDRGDLAVGAALTPDGGAITTANDAGIWTRIDDVVTKLAREGDSAPGAGAGVVYGELPTGDATLFRFNDAGDVAFNATLSGTGVTGDNFAALFGPDGAGGVTLVARRGSPAPGADGATFLDFYSAAVDSHGGLWFAGYLQGFGVTSANAWGIWSARPGQAAALVLRSGAAAPGGGTYEFDLDDFHVNRRRELVLQANAQGQARLFLLRGGIGRKILAPGDSLEIAPGVFRTITALHFESSSYPSGGEDGWRQALTDAGELVARATVDDLGTPRQAIVRIALHPANEIFWDDFEAGDLLDWSAAAGAS